MKLQILIFAFISLTIRFMYPKISLKLVSWKIFPFFIFFWGGGDGGSGPGSQKPLPAILGQAGW